jgi:RimJ/RimL family protein N-acetyltransferase
MIDFRQGVTLEALDRTWLNLVRGWRNTPDIYFWCRQNDLISDADQERWYDQQSADDTVKMYLIKAGDVPVGVCGLTSIDLSNRRAEFSLYIAPGHHRCGYGRKALSTLLSHGFRNLGLNLIWGESFRGNPACQMFAGMGFVCEGARREFYFKDGKFIDALLYSITAREWEAQWKVRTLQGSSAESSPEPLPAA